MNTNMRNAGARTRKIERNEKRMTFFVEYKAQFNTQRSIVESMFVFREYLLANCELKLYSKKQFALIT